MERLRLAGEYLVRTTLAWIAPVTTCVTLYQIAAVYRPAWGLPSLSRTVIEIVAFIVLLIAPIFGYVRLGLVRNTLKKDNLELSERLRFQEKKVKRLEEQLAPLPFKAGDVFEIVSQEEIPSPLTEAPYGLKATIRTRKTLGPAQMCFEFSAPITLRKDDGVDYGIVGQISSTSGFSQQWYGSTLLFGLSSPPLTPAMSLWIKVYSRTPIRLLWVEEV